MFYSCVIVMTVILASQNQDAGKSASDISQQGIYGKWITVTQSPNTVNYPFLRIAKHLESYSR